MGGIFNMNTNLGRYEATWFSSYGKLMFLAKLTIFLVGIVLELVLWGWKGV